MKNNDSPYLQDLRRQLSGKKIIIGPLNIASQPYYLASGLRKFGVDAQSIAYGAGTFGYESDKSKTLPADQLERVDVFNETLLEAYEENFDIYHFFQRPFYLPIPPGDHDSFLGAEIPILKSRGKRVAYRFTGWELIDEEIERRNNPYTAFKHGWDGKFNREFKKEYLEFLRAQVDTFMVVDPMMREHCPEARIVPRILPVDNFDEVGIERRKRPLIIHAPSNSTYKGSKFIIAALEALRAKGVEFDLKLLDRVPFAEALEWYKRADIIIDQMLIGWYGVLATECMAMGKPVAVYMRPDLADTPGEIPVHNINPDNIEERLRLLIEDFDLRLDLASRGRAYVEKVHSEVAVIPKLMQVYVDILQNPNLDSPNRGDFEFLRLQRRKYEEMSNSVHRLKRASATERAKRVAAQKQSKVLAYKLSKTALPQRDQAIDDVKKQVDTFRERYAAAKAKVENFVEREQKLKDRLARTQEGAATQKSIAKRQVDTFRERYAAAKAKVENFVEREQKLKDRLAQAQEGAAKQKSIAKVLRRTSAPNGAAMHIAELEAEVTKLTRENANLREELYRINNSAGPSSMALEKAKYDK